MSYLFRSLFALNVALLPAIPSAAHEFWIDPLDYTISPGDQLEAHIRVGSNYDGTSLVYLPRNFSRFEVAIGEELIPVDGRMGARPALQMDAPGEGLAVVIYEATDNIVNWDEWERFVGFCEHKDFTEVLDRHLERGLPLTGFSESYTRHVKSLVAIGDGAGEDREFGLQTEFVALANPYTDDLSDGMPVRLLLEGEPRRDVQVELWDRDPDGEISVVKYRTDQDGEALLPVEPGHVYMADSVTMLELDPEMPDDPVWHSLWASLTFEVPAE